MTSTLGLPSRFLRSWQTLEVYIGNQLQARMQGGGGGGSNDPPFSVGTKTFLCTLLSNEVDYSADIKVYYIYIATKVSTPFIKHSDIITIAASWPRGNTQVLKRFAAR